MELVRPFLSVCIPTYNQSDRYELLLKNINFNLNIEVIVRDDSDNDKSLIISEKYKIYNNFYYFKKRKKGLDNALFVFNKIAKGKYIWWIGDDYLYEDSLDRLIKILQSNDKDFIFINSKEEGIVDHRSVNIKNSFFFKNTDDLLKIDLGLYGFITATVFKRSAGMQFMKKSKKYLGSNFWCLYFILLIITNSKKNFFYSEILFESKKKKPGEIRWYNSFIVHGITLFLISNEFKKKFSKSKLKDFQQQNIIKIIKAVILEKVKGFDTGFALKNNYSKLIPLYWRFPKFWIYFLLLYVPTKFISFFYYRLILR